MKRTKTLINDLNKAMRAIDQLSEEEQDKLPWWAQQLVFDWATTLPEKGEINPDNKYRLETGPDNERGKTWFGNDGIDCRTMRVAPA